MTLSEMKQLLEVGGITLTKSLGQNFLHDGNQLRRIVEAAELTEADRVLEIGPGLGPLTEVLLPEANSVLAIEKDLRLVEVLRARFAAEPRLELVHRDALKFLQTEERDWSEWKLVSNLPYSVASPILVELAQSARPPRRMVATLQWEVARRLVAAADSSDYGVLTLLVQLHFEARGYFKIPSTCFFPAPDVDSACVTLVRRATPWLEGAQVQTFVRVVKRGFSQRRKMMLKLLREDWPGDRLEAGFASAALDPRVRAEAVTLEQFVKLSQAL